MTPIASPRLGSAATSNVSSTSPQLQRVKDGKPEKYDKKQQSQSSPNMTLFNQAKKRSSKRLQSRARKHYNDPEAEEDEDDEEEEEKEEEEEDRYQILDVLMMMMLLSAKSRKSTKL